jgi:hypothetical protein
MPRPRRGTTTKAVVVVVGPKGSTDVGCVDSSNNASIDARHAAGGYIVFPSLR